MNADIKVKRDMKYLIVENERIAREELLKKMEFLRPDWEYAGFAETISEVVGLLSQPHEIDLMFLDIELDDGQSFEIFNKVETDVSIIFTTAYSDYALRAFHLNSLDYLLKPFSLTDLETALKKFERFSSAEAQKMSAESQHYHKNSDSNDMLKEDEKTSPGAPEATPMPGIPRILLLKGDRYIPVPIEDIMWFESEDKCVMCICRDGLSRLTCFKSLKELTGRLPRTSFYQLRRNIFSSIEAVVEVNKFFKGTLKVTLAAGERKETVIVPQPNRQGFLDWLGMH